MRCYHFGNMYLSSIQQGIQSAHGQMELFNKYVPQTDEDAVPDELFTQLFDWSQNHKTMICLNAGDLYSMNEVYNFVNNSNNPYPYAKFNESADAMDGLMTNIAMVLPPKIYEVSKLLRSRSIRFSNPMKHIMKPGTNNNNPETKDMVFHIVELTETLNSFETEGILAMDIFKDLKDFSEMEFSPFEAELCRKLNNFGLAR